MPASYDVRAGGGVGPDRLADRHGGNGGGSGPGQGGSEELQGAARERQRAGARLPQLRAGTKIPMHSHPAYVSYSISGPGKTKFTSADGKTTEAAAATGQATWHDAETHASEYEGTGTTHVLLVELKGGAR